MAPLAILGRLLGWVDPQGQAPGGGPNAPGVQTETITANTPNSQTASASATYTGSYSGTVTPLALDYSTDGGSSWTAASTPTIGGGAWSFVATAPTAGTYTLKVRDHTATTVIGTSGSFVTAAESIAVATPGNNQAAGGTYIYSGTGAGTAAAALDFEFDAAGYGAAPSPTITPSPTGWTWSFSTTAPAAGSHTLSVRDHTNTGVSGTSGSFTTVTVAIVNLHNAPAWGASTFSNGQRITNASKAYQVVNPGTSTGAPTGTGTSINNGGVAAFKYLSGVDATNLNTWVAANQGTLPGATEIRFWNDLPGTAWNGGVTISGITTSSTHDLTITSAPGEGFADNANSATNKLQMNPSYGVALYSNTNALMATLRVESDDVTVKNLQVRNQNSYRGGYGIQFTGKNNTVDQFIGWCAPSDDAAAIHFKPAVAYTGTIQITNFLIIEAFTGHGNTGIQFNSMPSNVHVEGGTFVFPTNYGTTIEAGGIHGVYCHSGGTMRNCAFVNIEFPINLTNNHFVADGHNASAPFGASSFSYSGGVADTGAASGLITNVSTAALGDFIQPSNSSNGMNMRLAPGSTLIAAGSTAVISTHDIFGRPRGTAFSIGAVQYP